MMIDAFKRVGFGAASILVVTGLMRLTSPQEIEIASYTKSNSENETQATSPQIGAIQYAPAYSALDPNVSLTTAAIKTTFDPSDEYWGLPRAEGVDEVAAYCAACHSLQIVMQQRQTEEGWNYLLLWMVEKQGMAPMPEDTRATILNYLTTNFGAQD